MSAETPAPADPKLRERMARAAREAIKRAQNMSGAGRVTTLRVAQMLRDGVSKTGHDKPTD